MSDSQEMLRPSTRIWGQGLVAFLALVLIVMPPTVSRAEVLLERAVVLTGEWAPFTSKRMNGGGMLSALVTEVLRGMGREPAYEFLPFSDALGKTAEGKAFGTFPWFRNAEREKRFVFSKPILDVEYVIFFNPLKKSGIADITSFDELKKFKTVRVAGYAYGKLDCLLDQGSADCRRDANPPVIGDKNTVDSDYRAFEQLLQGKVDYVAASRAVGETLIRKAFPFEDRDRFAILERPELRWSMAVHFLFSRSRSDAVDLKRAFDKALDAVAATGRVAELRQSLDWQMRWQRNLVTIGDPPDGGPISGRLGAGAQDAVVLPHGTRAVVLQWSARFRGEASAANASSVSEVQIVNGPLRGRRVWVKDDLIRLGGN